MVAVATAAAEVARMAVAAATALINRGLLLDF